MGVAAEDDPALADPRAGLEPRPAEVSLLLLRSPEGVTLGSALTRRPEVVAEIRQIPGIGDVRTSRIGGTVGPGGEHWLGLLAVARLPDPCAHPLDRLTEALRAFTAERLASFGAVLELGRVEGAWCPGFSDLSIGQRKLVGLGLHLTAGWGLVRGVVAVSTPDQAELVRLDRCHRTFGPGVDPARMTSLSELPGLEGIDREKAIRLLGDRDLVPAKMAR
ncbi:MAG TPA: hypothetical protein VI138_00315 [Candidatus Dormibacteraeota bacterium]